MTDLTTIRHGNVLMATDMPNGSPIVVRKVTRPVQVMPRRRRSETRARSQWITRSGDPMRAIRQVMPVICCRESGDLEGDVGDPFWLHW
ncbi:MAG: hypothetical protein ABS36_00270 [Acidobacteria bacterium SCN 69-37]|nr:MAG: hypothetical protein ABS36_00270 [Acidobacteria bacterium SCN 69-37]